MPITELLLRNARDFGNETALVELNPEAEAEHEKKKKAWREFELIEALDSGLYRRELSWKEFNAKANRMGNLLIARGYKKGDKIGILLMNCLEWLPIYFGILKAGMIAVPLNFRYTSEEIKYCAELAECSVLIFGPEFVGRVNEVSSDMQKVTSMIYVGEDCPMFAQSYEKLVRACSEEEPDESITDEDFGAIYFSSGTTGFPKAILHKHKSLSQSAVVEQNHHGQSREDCFLCIPPLYHTGAKMHWFGSLISGSKAVLLRGVSPEWILSAVSKERCTIVWLLVPWAQDMLDAIERGDIVLSNYEIKQWRLMHIGAQPVSPSLIKRWMEVFPGHSYDTNYGLSEAIGPGCVHLGMENIHKVGAIGVPGYGWEAIVADSDGAEMPRNVVGELIVRGDGVMECYYRNERASAQSLRNGWLFTGDMAYMDDDGFIYLVDRKKDLIISGGENIYPVQIEDHLHRMEAIKDVAVIGLPDKRLGEIAAAIISIKPGFECTEEDINRFCCSLPRYKRPRKIIFDEIPRNPTGKIEKPKLREKYGAGMLVEKLTEA
ncbi:MAG: acyl--CoA ligase [Firmicutes bacterium]|nr:acyl--CoA ligase [Bacillota bacterium]